MLLEVLIGKDIYVIGGMTQDGPFKGPGKTLEVTINSTNQLRVREPNRIQQHNICIVGFLSFERLRWIFTIAWHSTRTWGAWGKLQFAKTLSFFSDFLIQQVPANFRAIVVQLYVMSYVCKKNAVTLTMAVGVARRAARSQTTAVTFLALLVVQLYWAFIGYRTA